MTDDAENKGASAPAEPMSDDVDILHVAYCDILGFSSPTLTDFNKTLTTYKAFGDLMSGGAIFKGVKATIYSDAILITATSLDRILLAAQGVWFLPWQMTS